MDTKAMIFSSILSINIISIIAGLFATLLLFLLTIATLIDLEIDFIKELSN